MLTKKLIIITPIGITFFLIQSFFWVPTYDGQAQKNKNRLSQYIQGSIGDAEILNPILSADSASSQINELIFDGLIDLDSNLNYRPRLAKDWTEYEEAYLALNFDFELNGKKLKNGYLWKKFILDELKKNVRWFKNIEKIEILYGEEKLEELLVKSKKIGIPDSKIHYIVNIPDRIKFTLQKV